jgi:hypothetical protein
MPYPVLCSCWPGGYPGGRCKSPALRWLIHPDGTRNPGGYVCQTHADEILSEYRDKLGESWSTVPIVQESVGTCA